MRDRARVAGDVPSFLRKGPLPLWLLFQKPQVLSKNNDAIDYLESVLGPEISGKGATDGKVDKLKEAELCDAFDSYVCGRPDDVGCDFFKVAEGDVIYLFNGKWYEKIDDVKLRFIVKEVMKRTHVGIVYVRNSAGKIADECKESLLSCEWCRFEPDRRYVVFRNGVLDTERKGFYAHDIKYKTDIVLNFNYLSSERSALWDRLIRQTVPDDGMRSAMQQFCGALLADRRKFKIEYMLMLVGSGRNGKSVVTDAIAGVFGDDLVSSYSPEQLFGNSGHSLYNLADINGKLANICDDLKNKDFSGGEFKQFISGHKFQARHIYGRPFVVTKIPLMICCMNEIPPTTDDTMGHYRRLLPVLCPNQVAEKDVDYELPVKLATDESKAAIFNWLLEGYKEFVANKGRIDVSDSIRTIREDIKADANSARRWIREMGFTPVRPKGPSDPCWKPIRELMTEYMAFCRDYSENAKTSKAVGAIFRELGYASEKRRSTTWYCVGRPGEEEKPDDVLPQEQRDDLPF